MTTTHRIHVESSTRLRDLPQESVHLIVTSPPYPMIEMWDAGFTAQDPAIGEALAAGDGPAAFRRMHSLLDPVWREAHRVLVGGGIACINIGDATRTIGGSFALFPNHARVLSGLVDAGFSPLPQILWRKQTNAPNKFLGSGMLPPGAYVTLEHEHILIVRKGDRRDLRSGEERATRRRSAYFWEERNQWFSDVWFDLKGARQDLPAGETRHRSGAFPFELPYRLIHMFSIEGDTVLDPFLGSGTTLIAAMAAGRNSAGYEIDPDLVRVCDSRVEAMAEIAAERLDDRLAAHIAFVRERRRTRGPFVHRNAHHGFPVMTRQEVDLVLSRPGGPRRISPLAYEVDHYPSPPIAAEDWSSFFAAVAGSDAAADEPASRPVTHAHRKL